MKKFYLIIILAALTFTWLFPVSADNNTDINNKVDEIGNKLDTIQKKKQQIENDKKKLEKDRLELIDSQKKENLEYQEISKEITDIDNELNKLETSLKETEEDYNAQMELFKSRLVAMYENSYVPYIEILADSSNFIDLLERLEIISAITEKNNDLIESLETAKKDVEFKKALLQDVKSEKQEEFNKKREKIDLILASRASLEDRISKSKSELEKLEKQEDKLIEESNALTSEIRGISDGKAKYAGGKMIWPVPSSKKIDSPFGYRIHPVYKKKKMHTGVDIDAAMGASIIAANSGKVISSGWKDGYGNTVIIDHGGGITTLYAHCSKLLVKTGSKVEAGQTIAKAGKTGVATGPHLHFEVRINGEVTNPLNYIEP